MGKARYVDANLATHREHITMRSIPRINEYVRDGFYLYYGKPYYNDPEYDTGILLLSFRIRKETHCYYMLECGLRINKHLDGKTFALNPHEAARFCIKRTQNYFDILYNRLKTVQNFLKNSDVMRRGGSTSIKELRIFENLAKEFSDTDEIPVELYKDFALNPELRIGDILR